MVSPKTRVDSETGVDHEGARDGRGARVMAAGLLTAVVVAAACAGNPTSPSGGQERISWTANGESFTASSNGRGALRAGANVSLTGTDCGRGAALSVLVRASGVGTYNVGNGDGMASISWTPDARTGAAASEAWYAPGTPRVVGGQLVTGGSGSVTISSMTSDWVTGSFAGEVVPNANNRDASLKRIEGTFELSFRERTIC